MSTACQSCFSRPPLARTKANKRYRLIPDHDLCAECERKYWDRQREEKKEEKEENNERTSE